MFGERQVLLKRIRIVWDLAANALAFYFAFTIKTNFLPVHVRGLTINDDLFITMLIIPFLYYAWGMKFEFFDAVQFKNTRQLFVVAGKTMAGLIISLLVFFFVFKFESISRILIFLYGGAATILVIIDRLLLRRVLVFLGKTGFNSRNVLIVGTGKKAKEFIDAAENHEAWGINVLGLLDMHESMVGKKRHGYKILGTDTMLREILLTYPIDEVVCAVPLRKMDNIQKIIETSEEVGVTVKLISNFFRMLIAKTDIEHFNGLPILTFTSTPNHLLPLFLKRTLDIVMSLLILILMSPLFIVVGLIIKLSSTGPVFFIQERCRLNGRRFKMLKFRTMVDNAEELKGVLAGVNEMSGPVFKIKNDPRVTPIGRFLRKTSFDEFPQFINVLRGEMSIVGPRPPVPQEVKKYEIWQRRRLSMRPGLTCFWQISGRNKIGFDEWMKLDLSYIDNWSLWLDLKIILKTIPVVLLCKGAS